MTLPLPDRRLTPLSVQQHEEIASLIASSMDSRAKHPLPSLSYMGRIVVQREVTALANLALVRRTKNHSSTFRRALAAWEKRIQEPGVLPRVERGGRLAIEHLWRWLHGYVTPAESRSNYSTAGLRDGDNFEVLSREESDQAARMFFSVFPDRRDNSDDHSEEWPEFIDVG